MSQVDKKCVTKSDFFFVNSENINTWTSMVFLVAPALILSEPEGFKYAIKRMW